MTVIEFAPKHPQGTWRPCELNGMVETFAAELAPREGFTWQTGTTEHGDPQFYLLGPPPEEDCVLCVSRIGRIYVLEDGAGRVVSESPSLDVLGEQALALLSAKKARFVASVALLWAAVRQTFEEKIEPLWNEGEELLVHVSPQLAAII